MSVDNFFKNIPRNELANNDNTELMNSCFEHFDTDGDDGLNIKEFGALARALLSDEEGQPYTLQARTIADIFFVFDKNKNGKIDREEFPFMWNKWIKTVLKPVSALIVVDVQNDFIDGSLAIRNCPAGQDGAEVVPVINHLLETVPFDLVIFSLDWHPDDHVSFIENVHMRKIHEKSEINNPDDVKVLDTVIFEGPPEIEQKLWPRHCVQNTWGSQLHCDLKVLDDALYIHKGTSPNIDSYSAFWDNNKMSQTNLNNELKERGITDVYCCGVAYDYCVGSTALHALENGYRTALVHDASRGVSLDNISEMQKKMVSQNGLIVNSDKILAMTEGRDCRSELGYRAAMILCENKNEDNVTDGSP